MGYENVILAKESIPISSRPIKMLTGFINYIPGCHESKSVTKLEIDIIISLCYAFEIDFLKETKKSKIKEIGYYDILHLKGLILSKMGRNLYEYHSGKYDPLSDNLLNVLVESIQQEMDKKDEPEQQ